MQALSIYYSVPDYRSHRRMAIAYRRIIQNKHTVITDIDDAINADIIILHREPHDYDALYRQFPALKNKYVIGYCLWEATELPKSYKKSIEYVQEIWTPSQYCYNIFAKYHPRVVYIPHLVDRNIECSAEDDAFVKELVNYQEDCIYYLSITKLRDTRKNVHGLVEAFQQQCSKMPKARLIIKALQAEQVDFNCGPQVICLPMELTDTQINALYALSHIYVSAHHSEGWGLPLSDAMIFNKLVVATGYSGNLEFMDEDNSVLIDFTEEYVRAEDHYHLFDSSMKWGYPKQDDLERKLLLCYEGIDKEWAVEKKRRALATIDRFNEPAVDKLISQRLNEIAKMLVSA